MTLEEIKSSGLLELYVLNELPASEVKVVTDALDQYPELKQDLLEIEKSLEIYAQAHALKAPGSVKDDLIKQAKKDAGNSKVSTSTASRNNNWLGILLGLGLAVFAFLFYLKNRELNELKAQMEQYQIDCDSLRAVSETNYALIQEIQDPNNRIIPIQTNENFPQTRIYIYDNDVADRNYMQIQNLPPLSANQSFQLWALKDNEDPIPLDVFQSDAGPIFEVRHVDDTNAYAITIEPLGGRQSPTLANLIGVFDVSG